MEGGHAVFDGFDGVGAVAEGGAAGAFGNVLDEGGDADGASQVGADENDAVADGGGSEREGGGFSGEEPAPGDGNVTGDGFLRQIQVWLSVAGDPGRFRGGAAVGGGP